MKVKRFLATALTVILTFGMVVPSVTMAMEPTGSLEIEVPESGDAEITHDDCICDECNEEFDVGTYDVELGSENLDTFEGGVEIENPTVDDLIVEEPIVNPVIEEPEEEPKEEPIEEEQTVEEPEVEEQDEGSNSINDIFDMKYTFHSGKAATVDSDGYMDYYEVYDPGVSFKKYTTYYWDARYVEEVVKGQLYNYTGTTYYRLTDFTQGDGRIPKLTADVQFLGDTPIVHQDEVTGRMYIDMDIINNGTYSTQNAYVHIEWVDKNTGALVSDDIPFELAIEGTTSLQWELPDCTAMYTVCIYNNGSRASKDNYVGGYPTHSINYVAGVAATCTTPGYKDYYICKQCGKYFEDNKGTKEITDLEAWKSEGGNGYIAPVTEHTFVLKRIVKPTCTEYGYNVYECSNCQKLKTEYVKPYGHIPGFPLRENVVAPTCTTPGSYDLVQYCEECEEEVSRKTYTTDPLSHKLKETAQKDPTFHEDGHKAYWQCTECKKYFSDEEGKNEITNLNEWLKDENGGLLPMLTASVTYDITAIEGRKITVHVWNDGTGTVEFSTDLYTTSGQKVTKKGVTDAVMTVELEDCKDAAYLYIGYDIPGGGGNYSDGRIIDGLEHTIVVDEGYAPTCTEYGKTDGTHCSYCGKVLAEQQPIKPTGHTWTDIKKNYVAPTCTKAGGYDKYVKCTVCGVEQGSYGHVELPATGHDSVFHIGAFPTRDSVGYRCYYSCNKCGQYYLDQFGILAIIDDFDTWYVTESDYMMEGRIIPKLYIDFEVTGKYTESGKYEYTIKNIGTDTVDHLKVYVDGIKTTDINSLMERKSVTGTANISKCQEHTLIIKENDVEVYRYTIEAETTGHDLTYVPEYTPCDLEGWCEHWHCENCGKNYTDETATEEIEDISLMRGHVFDEYKETNIVEPTCTELGTYDIEGHCTRCGEWITWMAGCQTAELGHQMEDAPQLDPTCTTAGHKAYSVCTRDACNYAVDENGTPIDNLDTWLAEGGDGYIAPTGHTPGEVVIENVIDATCQQPGSRDEVIYCTECGEEIARNTAIIPQLMHIAGEEVVENVVDATCEHSGSQDIVTYCTVCGDELTRETVTIPQLMHITDKVVIENYVEPTAKQAGGYDEVLYCTLCNKEVSRTHVTIPATGYSISKVEYKYLPDTGVVFIYAQDATVGKITTAITITKYEQDDVVLEYVMEVVDEMNGHANLYVEYTDISNPVLQAPSF